MDRITEFFETINHFIVIIGKVVMTYLDNLGEWGIVVVFIFFPVLMGMIISIFSGRHGKRRNAQKKRSSR